MTRTKVLFTVLLAGIVVGVIGIQANNTALFKGQIFKNEASEKSSSDTLDLLPDLKPKLLLINPETPDGDLIVNATIENAGPGEIDGTIPFKYTIFINDMEVFSNTDSYTTMLAGDSFSFSYPIPRTIYNYSNKGKVKFVLDTTNAISETNEENNEVEVEYEF